MGRTNVIRLVDRKAASVAEERARAENYKKALVRFIADLDEHEAGIAYEAAVKAVAFHAAGLDIEDLD